MNDDVAPMTIAEFDLQKHRKVFSGYLFCALSCRVYAFLILYVILSILLNILNFDYFSIIKSPDKYAESMKEYYRVYGYLIIQLFIIFISSKKIIYQMSEYSSFVYFLMLFNVSYSVVIFPFELYIQYFGRVPTSIIALHFTVAILIHICLLHASLSMTNLKQFERDMIKNQYSNRFYLYFLYVFEIPVSYFRSFKYSRRILFIISLFFSGFFISSGLFRLFLDNASMLRGTIFISQQCFLPDFKPIQADECVSNLLSRAHLSLNMILVKFEGIFLIFIGIVIQNAIRRKSIIAVREARANDKRNPILYLRPFKQDYYYLFTPNDCLLYALRNLFRKNDNIDSVLLEEGTVYGPVIALGDPQTLEAPYGPPREFPLGFDWQDYVLKSISEAPIIIVFVEDSAGVAWEIEKIIELGLVEKCIFIRSPRSPSFGEISCFSKIISWFHSKVAKDSSAALEEFWSEKGSTLVTMGPYRQIYAFKNGLDSDMDYRISIRASLRAKLEVSRNTISFRQKVGSRLPIVGRTGNRV